MEAGIDKRIYEKKFRQFGAWGNGRIGTEYPSRAAGIKGADYEKTYLDPLTDKEGEEIDRNLILMGKINQELFEVFYLVYVCNLTIEQIKRDVMFNASEGFIRARLREAEYFMIGRLIDERTIFFA